MVFNGTATMHNMTMARNLLYNKKSKKNIMKTEKIHVVVKFENGEMLDVLIDNNPNLKTK